MLRYRRLSSIGFCLKSSAGSSANMTRSTLLKSLLALLVMLLTAGSTSIGQEMENELPQSSVELEDDGESKELLAAMKSLDETMNKKDVLAKQKIVRDRLVGFGVVTGAILALLAVLFAYLRMDHATRGFHSGRLQMLAILISIMILVACYFLWTQVLFK